MKDFILFMHNDTTEAETNEAWEAYIKLLRDRGGFEGGSAIGEGVSLHKTRNTEALSTPITGYIRIRAKDIDEAKLYVNGNPVYECGGTIEIRELTPS